MTWVPDTCSLPTAEQPLRVAAFDALFTDTLHSATTISATHAQLTLDATPGTEARARELAARETGCCSFFTFGFAHNADGRLLVDITVPDGQAPVLAALTDRARATRQARP